MSIADAITALGPSLYWKLNETSGTVAADASGNGRTGTYQGSYAQGVAGPEAGTTAVRFYAGGKILSAALGYNGWRNISWMLWASVPAVGTAGQYPCMWVGLPSDWTDHGSELFFFSSGGTTPQWYSRAGSFQTTQTTVPQPLSGWHCITFTQHVTPNAVTCNVDMLAQASNSGATMAAPFQVTDPLILQSDYPMVVAHAAMFQRVLTTSEHQSVAALLPAWPYNPPINAAQPPPPSGNLSPTDPVVVNINADLSDIRRAVLHDYTSGPP